MESKYESFTSYVLNVIKNNAITNKHLSESDEQILELAEFLKIGNIHKVKYDPTIHENITCDIGDKLWAFDDIIPLETAKEIINVE